MFRAFYVLPIVYALLAGIAVAAGEVAPPAPSEPVPTPAQLAWQRTETVMFLHFGMNTFTNREWGEGKESEKLFNPSRLDARQWAKAAKAAGFDLVILTAKHHDGFCLWPSRVTEHCVKNSPWKGGQGDVVKEFTDACRAEGVRAGLYLSPWDRNQPAYGDSPRYNAYYRAQLTELLSNYGTVAEVWFDGACGEGPNGKRQEYDWPSYYGLIRKLQPQALIAICGPDIRWVGNESGFARENESSIQPASAEMHRGKTKVWYPAECDVSIRPGWFWHANEDSQVKSLAHLMRIYFASVGRNSNLLLNVPPNKEGLISAADIARLNEFKAALDKLYGSNLAAGCPLRASNVRGGSDRYGPDKVLDGNLDTYWATDDAVTSGWLEVDLGQPRMFNVVRVQEAIALGERVQAWHVEALVDGNWKTLCKGTVIGHKRLLRVPAVTATKVRLVIDRAKACPAIAEFGLHVMPMLGTAASGSVAANKPARASSVHPGEAEFGADNAVDDDLGTR